MDELVAWYRKQLDDDRRAAIHMTRWDDDFLEAIHDPDVRRYVNQVADPETVLADVAAKKKLLAALEDMAQDDYNPWAWNHIAILARAYRHRPGWKTEWEA